MMAGAGGRVPRGTSPQVHRAHVDAPIAAAVRLEMKFVPAGLVEPGLLAAGLEMWHA